MAEVMEEVIRAEELDLAEWLKSWKRRLAALLCTISRFPALDAVRLIREGRYLLGIEVAETSSCSSSRAHLHVVGMLGL